MDSTRLPAASLSPANRFVLRRCGDVWQVVLEGEPDFFGHTAGVTFIDHYLKRPVEPIHPVVLLARVQGQEPVQQAAGRRPVGVAGCRQLALAVRMACLTN